MPTSGDWKSKLGAALAAVFAAALAVDPDPKRTPIWQALLALAAGLFGVGAADKAQKSIDATNKQTVAIAATAGQAPPPAALTETEKAAKYDALMASK